MSDQLDGEMIGNDEVMTEQAENVQEPEKQAENSTEQVKTGQTEAKPEENTDKLFNQEAANRAFIKKKKQLNAERQAKAELEKKLAEREAELEKLQTGGRPELPEIPDQYDVSEEEYQAAIDKWKEANRQQILFNERQRQSEEAEKNRILEAQRKQQEETQKKIDGFYGRVEELGYQKDDMIKKENILVNYLTDGQNVRVDLAMHVVGREDAPLIVDYLSQNPKQLEAISQMNDMSAAAYIASEIAPKAQKLKPETTKTPPPLEVDGGKTKPEQNKWLEGGTFL